MCNMHYLRWYRGKDMHAPPKGTLCGNKAAHKRVKTLWGKAVEHLCVQCGDQAQDWAYDGTDPDDLPDDVYGRYSLYPEFYMPMCRPCHMRHDKSVDDCTICGGPGHAKDLCKYHYQLAWTQARRLVVHHH